MSKVIHFKDTAERMRYIRGKFTEVKPKEVTVEEPKKEKKPKAKPKKKKEKE